MQHYGSIAATFSLNVMQTPTKCLTLNVFKPFRYSTETCQVPNTFSGQASLAAVTRSDRLPVAQKIKRTETGPRLKWETCAPLTVADRPGLRWRSCDKRARTRTDRTRAEGGGGGGDGRRCECRQYELPYTCPIYV